MNIYAYIDIYMYIHTTYTYVCVYIYTHIYIHIYTYMHTPLWTTHTVDNGLQLLQADCWLCVTECVAMRVAVCFAVCNVACAAVRVAVCLLDHAPLKNGLPKIVTRAMQHTHLCTLTHVRTRAHPHAYIHA